MDIFRFNVRRSAFHRRSFPCFCGPSRFPRPSATVADLINYTAPRFPATRINCGKLAPLRKTIVHRCFKIFWYWQSAEMPKSQKKTPPVQRFASQCVAKRFNYPSADRERVSLTWVINGAAHQPHIHRSRWYGFQNSLIMFCFFFIQSLMHLFTIIYSLHPEH